MGASSDKSFMGVGATLFRGSTRLIPEEDSLVEFAFAARSRYSVGGGREAVGNTAAFVSGCPAIIVETRGRIGEFQA